VALVNSIYNELPSRRITESFITSAVHEATSAIVPPLAVRHSDFSSSANVVATWSKERFTVALLLGPL